MLAKILVLLSALFVSLFVGRLTLLFLIRLFFGNESELGKRYNNVAWDIAVYGTDEAFREELKHWRWKGRWRKKLFDLRDRRAEIAAYWAAKKQLAA